MLYQPAALPHTAASVGLGDFTGKPVAISLQENDYSQKRLGNNTHGLSENFLSAPVGSLGSSQAHVLPSGPTARRLLF